MNDTQTTPFPREALDEFIRQLFVCHWVLGQMIAGRLERARLDQDDADQESDGSDQEADDAYSLVRNAIGDVVDRHGIRQIESTTRLIDEVMDAISDDGRIFPADAAVASLAERDAHPRPVRRRRR